MGAKSRAASDRLLVDTASALHATPAEGMNPYGVVALWDAWNRADTRSRHAVALWTLAGLFLCRVLGQALVAVFDVAWLPPMDQWMSGLLPYPALLAAQVVLLTTHLRINLDVGRGRGRFAEIRERTADVLRRFSYVYCGVMVVRYGLTMALFPERRWLGIGTIPTVFHMVLAAYLYVYARSQTRTAGEVA